MGRASFAGAGTSLLWSTLVIGVPATIPNSSTLVFLCFLCARSDFESPLFPSASSAGDVTAVSFCCFFDDLRSDLSCRDLPFFLGLFTTKFTGSAASVTPFSTTRVFWRCCGSSSAAASCALLRFFVLESLIACSSLTVEKASQRKMHEQLLRNKNVRQNNIC